MRTAERQPAQVGDDDTADGAADARGYSTAVVMARSGTLSRLQQSDWGMTPPFSPVRSSMARRVGRFSSDRYRLTLEDEMDAKRLASHQRRGRGDKDLMVVRHMVWLERAEKDEKERQRREERERKEREAAERMVELETIHCLPEELMMSIFGMLDLEDLAKSVIPVCTRWRRLGRDESLWSRATLRYDPLAESPDDFIRALGAAPVLGALEYIADGAPTREDVAKALAKGCRRVLSLRLLPCLSENLLWIILDRLADHLQRLEVFVTDLGVLACIGGMDNLRSLVLHGEISFVSDKLSRLGSGCPLLTELDLGGLRFNDIYRLDVLIADVVRGHSDTLTSLKLPPSMAGSNVLGAVGRCTKLKVLAIWITPSITSGALCTALSTLERLESLTWRNYDAWLDKAELAHFILQSERFRSLREFRLLDCIDMDDGLALAIAHRAHSLDGLGQGHGLARLSLHRSELSARGLAEILQRALCLVSLDLYKNVSVSVEHLDLIAAHLKDLRELDVRGCYALRSLGPEVWQHLLDEVPGLNVRFD